MTVRFLRREHRHDWFPGHAAREYIPMTDICLRCHEERVVMPWGACLCGAALAQHYTPDGTPRPLADCPGPR